MIDFDGNFWSFGYNYFGQLAHGDTTNINIPKIIPTLKDIQQISHGSRGYHFFAKKLSKPNFCNPEKMISDNWNKRHSITFNS